MRPIRKSTEPSSLTRHRHAAFADYDNYDDKDMLRQYLVSEQRAICCYCMSRIQPDREHMKIAHCRSRRKYPNLQLDYHNLLAACPGGEGQSPSKQHCDTHQGDQDISRNPADPARQIDHDIHYGSDGRIWSDDEEFDRNINDVLNLNIAFLIGNRKARLDGFIRSLPKTGTLPRQKWENKLREWNGENGASDLEPFCQVIVYWLRKRLRRG